jgi:chromosome segregation ATPase
MGSLAFLNFRHRHTRPRVRQDLEILLGEYAEREKTLEAKLQETTEEREEIQKTLELVESQRDELLEERTETFKEKADLSSEVTLLTNKAGKLQDFEKKYNDLKWQLEKVEKKEDHMKGLESKCRWMEKLLAKAKEDQDDSRSLQIITETEVETMERSVQQKDGELSKKETELKAALRTRKSDEVAVQKAHRMVFLLSAKAHKERRSALQTQRMYRQAKQEAKHHAPTAHQGDAPTPHECDHSPYLKTIGLQADTIANLQKESSAKAASKIDAIPAIPAHVCDHSKCGPLVENQTEVTKLSDDKVDEQQSALDGSASAPKRSEKEAVDTDIVAAAAALICDHSNCDLLMATQKQSIKRLDDKVVGLQSALDSSESARKRSDLLADNHKRNTKRSDDKVDKLQLDLDCSESALEHLKEEYAKLQSTIEDDFEEYLGSDNEEDKDEPVTETPEVPPGDYDPDNEDDDEEAAAKEALEVAPSGYGSDGEENQKEPATDEVPELAPPAAHEVPLPEATDADIEGQQSLLEDRDATIDQLQANLEDEEACRKALEAKNAEHVCDHSHCSSQANKKDGRIQELGDELITQKQRAKGRIEELRDELTTEKQSLEGHIQRLDNQLISQKQILEGHIQGLDNQLITQKQNLEGRIQELENQLSTQKQSTEESNTCLETSRMEKETALTILANERKANEKNCQIANLSTKMTAPSKGNEVRDLKRELYAKRLQCEGLQLSLADRDATIASLNGDISKAGNQFNDLKLSLGMSSDYGITDVECELKQQKAAFEGLGHEARNHVCDHSECHYTRSQLELQTATLQQALDNADGKYAGLEKTVKEMDMAIKRRNAQIKSMLVVDTEKEEKHQQLKKKLLSDIEVAKGQAGLRYETSQPGYQPLRDQMLDMKATLDATKQNLEKTTQELRDRTQERDHEMKCALGFKEDSERFAASAIREQAAYLDCMKARDELANQKQNCEQEIERLRLQMAELAK